MSATSRSIENLRLEALVAKDHVVDLCFALGHLELNAVVHFLQAFLVGTFIDDDNYIVIGILV